MCSVVRLKTISQQEKGFLAVNLNALWLWFHSFTAHVLKKKTMAYSVTVFFNMPLLPIEIFKLMYFF